MGCMEQETRILQLGMGSLDDDCKSISSYNYTIGLVKGMQNPYSHQNGNEILVIGWLVHQGFTVLRMVKC